MNRHLRVLPWAAALALAAMSATAQNAAPANPSTPAATVGTTPQEASTAMQKAVPRSDTATVVRTAPSAADKASATLNGAADTAAANNTGTGTGMSSSTTSSTGSTSTRPMRTARADRN